MADEWYIGKNGSRIGPLSPAQVRQMAVRGELGPEDMIWKSGMAQWVSCSSVKGLFGAGVVQASGQSAGVEPNPYAAAVSPGDAFGNGGVASPSGALVYADFLHRVGASVLDGLFLGLMLCLPTIGIAVVFVAGAGNNPQDQQAASVASNACSQVIGLIVGCIYSVTLDSSAKQGTWGKQIVGLKVTDLAGQRISVGRAFGRFFARYLSVCTCGIGFLLPLFTEKRQTLHELICGCLTLQK